MEIKVIAMLQRRYTSIAEEPEGENITMESKRNGANDKIPIAKSNSTSRSSSRRSPKSARISSSEPIEDLDGESESDRFSFSDDDYVYSEEGDDKSLKKERGALVAKEKNKTSMRKVSRLEEEIMKSSKLTSEQIREIKEAFHVFDNNGDGYITATELKKLVTSLGYNITEAELMDMMNQIDSDGNGAIDFPEFLSLMTKNIEDCDPEDILLESFKVFDRDNSGFIGVSELDRVFKLLGQEFKDYEIEAMIKAADSDGDGLVGWDDFTKMMKV